LRRQRHFRWRALDLATKSNNKSYVSSKTGISKLILSELTLNESTHLRDKELYLIALAIHVAQQKCLLRYMKGLNYIIF
jgi:putative transcriptional regulator